MNTQYHLTQFDHLGEDGFADFLNAVLKEIFGPSLVPFGKGKDGGRDAIFEGIPHKYEKVEGYWVFQYKFHEIGRINNTKARQKVKQDIPKEIKKILKLPRKVDCYILITNAELFTSDFGDWLDKEIKSKYASKFDYLGIWDSKSISIWLNDPNFSKIREKYLPKTITHLQDVSDLITKDLFIETYPHTALKQIKEGIYSQNFDWFKDTLEKYYNLVSIETKRELADITLIWLNKYPDRSTDIFDTLNELFEPIDFSFNSIKHNVIQDYSLNVISEILLKLVDNFKKDNNRTYLAKLRNFIITRFDLITDNSRYYFSSPSKIYLVLKELNPDLSDIAQTVNKLSWQFKERHGDIYKGYEHIGSGVSQSGNEFSLSDLAIVDDFLGNVFIENYEINPSETWSIIKEDILSRRVSKSNPHWILRSTIPVVLDRLSDINTEEEAKDSLIKLINIKQGIPSCSDKIFNLLRINLNNYSEKIIIDLIEADISKYDVPTNVFVVITLFELLRRKNIKAKHILFALLDNEKYLKYDSFNYDTLVHFHIIANQPELKLQIINKLLDSKEWKEKALDQNNFVIISDMPRAFQSMAVEAANANNGDLKFLEDFLGNGKDDLKIKIVFESLVEIAKKFPEQTFKFIKKRIKAIDKIEDFIRDAYTRSQVVSVAEELAVQGMGKSLFGF